MSKEKIILDLCGGTGAWSKPYKVAGFTVINCTLPEIDICETKFYDDYMVLQNKDTRYTPHIYYRDVIGVLAAPPCTEFSIAKSTAPRDFVK
jgi:site-specific DNA-cytosine methylase